MQDVSKLYSIEDLRRSAKQRLPRAIFDFFDGGAEDEITLKANISAFQQQFLRPSALQDVSQIDTSLSIFNRDIAFPCAIAPTGAVSFGWREGDVAIAKAASKHQIPYSLSTTATASIEKIAKLAKGRLWFQAYVLQDQTFFHQLIDRALAADYEALMITIDLPVGGKRERDLHNHFSIPFQFTRRNLMDFATKPLWALPMLLQGIPALENLIGLHTHSTIKQTSSVGKNYDPSFDWDRLQKVRDRWPRKLIIKGVQSASDAKRLASMGVDMLVVSNHGGRQLDGAQATLKILPEILSEVGEDLPVWMDGGVRRGSDILKAVAMGAKGVLIGRATLYGALAAGEAGANRALEILKDELIRTMQLTGMRSIEEIRQHKTHLLI